MSDREKTIEKLERFAQSKGLSYSKIANMIGIGGSTLSEIRKGTYKGQMEEYLMKIESFLERHKSGMKRITFSANTEVKRKIFFAIDTIKKYVASNAANEILGSAKIAYIIGRAGIGKTHSLQEYRRIYGAKILFITAENGDNATVMMRKIARELKLDHKKRVYDLKEEIKTRLKFTETIIIIDESEHLTAKVIDNIRAIVDQTGIGLVLSGTEKLRHQITGLRGEYEYLYSRAVIWMLLSELKLEDVDAIFRKFISDDLDYYKEEQIVKIVSYLYKETKGSARILENLLGMVSLLINEGENFEKTGGLINMDYLKAASRMISTI